ncbi:MULTISPECIES: hypothetical protein [Streptomyces]|uniref:Uncharacterized protein n=1 Tax=Streptomyces doudnae TaxID=3075536 RepID=A0ABD5EJR8_9ACTN|nr:MULTISPECIES: hypothetical protein [unclassified Streptomyces]MDT0434090.1 hypothetical protein [Streptomyces sp. DSM 41981]MYQ64980.1 hypothetical protein [Streptomyces sp. SID4950]SCD90162.1 hypothetical protein GA0115242_11684 [Streptomyces sp. SolWspMP-5a-2]
MFRRRENTDAGQALRQQENDLECAARARKWGMEENAEKWESSAGAAFDDFLRITKKRDDRRRNQ